VILGLGLPLVLHFSVMEIPSLATTTDGKLRMVGLFGSMEQKEKLDYSFYLRIAQLFFQKKRFLLVSLQIVMF
jgi:hypothetical protein